jgi:hypothetical protein
MCLCPGLEAIPWKRFEKSLNSLCRNMREEAIIEFGPSQTELSEILAEKPTFTTHEDIIVETYKVADDTYFLQTTHDGGWVMYSAIECHTSEVSS